MFCYQCEQTAKGVGCTAFGICGKDPETASLQDLLVHAAKGISMWAHRARQLGAPSRELDVFVIEALFSTVTNVNFDPDRLCSLLRQATAMRDKARALYEQACRKSGKVPEPLKGPAEWTPAAERQALVLQGEEVSTSRRQSRLGKDITGLQELILYGLKGMAAYADHAQILGKEDDGVHAFFHEALDLLTAERPSRDGLLTMALRCGEMNLKVMELLDAAHTTAYGNPSPTPVRIEPLKGKAILASGHDLKDLECLLKQSEGQGINVYTHGEMLAAHGYPGLRKSGRLVANYGGAWQDQRDEFDRFPGAILMTTNCLQKPKDSYRDRLFTSGLVAWPGVRHIADRDFSPVIAAARRAGGFEADGPGRTILVGFGHNAILQRAGQIAEAVKSGRIRHFFLIGGCDGAKGGRNYYTDFARAIPSDAVILTLACGKYRFNKLDFGDVSGIPRLLDCGQCNDAYSAIQAALALAQAFNCGVNDLPLSLILSWYEQKAVCILLTLLHLGIRNIRLGPSLPAFVTPAVLEILAQKFNIMPITTAEGDLKAILRSR
jgi:hydroxylamine reductase